MAEGAVAEAPVAEAPTVPAGDKRRRRRKRSDNRPDLVSVPTLYEEPAADAEPEPAPQLIDLTTEPDVDAMSAAVTPEVFTPEVVVPEIIDLTTEPESQPRPRHLELLPSPVARRERSHVRGARRPASRPAGRDRRRHRTEGGAGPAALPHRSRALRITTVKSNGRRRWAVDFLVREPDTNDQSE